MVSWNNRRSTASATLTISPAGQGKYGTLMQQAVSGGLLGPSSRLRGGATEGHDLESSIPICDSAAFVVVDNIAAHLPDLCLWST